MHKMCNVLLFLVFLSAVSAASDKVVRLSGTPSEMGKQHGTLVGEQIRLMVREYIGDELIDGRLNEAAQKRVTAMKPSLPKWFMDELNACADAAKLDRDVLLYAQCEGDIRSLPGCTTYVAFGKATTDGEVEIGRNFDYWGLDSTKQCVRIFTFLPTTKGHHSFISVGWTGILGGWTFYNEKGLFVANNLGGFEGKNPKGIPTLILERIIIERAATVEEAIDIIKASPRMRGQAIILGHAGDPKEGIKPSAAVVLYDANRVVVKRPRNGVAFHSSTGTDEAELRANVRARNARCYAAIRAAGTGITLHSVSIDPANHKIWVAHGTRPGAHRGKYVPYDITDLFKRPAR